jgi:DNA-binding SARP family transcriptional activator
MLNKITPPRLNYELSRHRLFEKLDRLHDVQAIWISGPAGAGKSTLAASYVSEKQIPSLWYQIDSSDEDPASYFYYLGLAVEKTQDGLDVPLPFLTPEYSDGLDAFVRRYFENLYECIKIPFWIIFDNFHEVLLSSPLLRIMQLAVELVPPGLKIVVISRNDPAPEMARLQANQRLKMIGWKDLAFTETEFQDVIELLGSHCIPDSKVKLVHRQTRGWIAGLVLWLLQSDPEKRMPDSLSTKTPAIIFDYFASEIFGKIDPQTRKFLIISSLLEEINAATAEQLSGLKDAAEMLDSFYRRNFFLEKHEGSASIYQYHPLFLDFLRIQAQRSFDPDTLKTLRCRAAEIQVGSGLFQKAAKLYHTAQEWDGLAKLILSQAPELFFQGRQHTLRVWMNYLPAEFVRKNPWLLFWQAVGRMPLDPMKSRKYCEQAFELFFSIGDFFGQVLSFAAAVESFFIVRGNMNELDRWIEEGLRLASQIDSISDNDITGRFTAGMLGALTIRNPNHLKIEYWIDRSMAVLNQSADSNLQYTLGNFLVLILCWRGEVHQARLLIERLQHRIEEKNIQPLSRILFSVMQCVYYLATGESEHCRQTAEKALKVSADTGVSVYDCLLYSYGVYGALATGDMTNAHHFLQQMSSKLRSEAIIDIAHYHSLCAWEALILGRASLARVQIETALTLGVANGAPVATVITGRLLFVKILAADGQLELAEKYLKSIVGEATANGCALIEFHELLTKAEISFLKGDDSGGFNCIQHAFNLSRHKGILDGNWWQRSRLTGLCQRALEAGIEIDQVLAFITRHRLMPSAPLETGPVWPWPVKIYSLGCFKILCYDQPLVLRHKVPKKPLELLKILICKGKNGISRHLAADLMWPETDGDRAQQNLDTTLHRLRRLLGQDRGIRVEDTRLILAPEICWSDAWYFESLLHQAAEAAGPAKEKFLKKAIDIYGGPLEADGEFNSAAVSYADQLKTKMIQAILSLAGIFEDAGKLDQAIAVCNQGLDIHDDVESLYQVLMQLFAHQGRLGEALSTYNRCAQILKSRFDIKPGSKTLLIYHEIRSKG